METNDYMVFRDVRNWLVRQHYAGHDFATWLLTVLASES